MSTPTVEITREVAAKVLSIVDAGLSEGLGNPKPGERVRGDWVGTDSGWRFVPHGTDPAGVSCISCPIVYEAP